MIIDNKTFTELAVHLRIASDAILTTANHLSTISATDNPPAEDAEWGSTIDSMMSVSAELHVMDRLLYAVLNANSEEEPQEGSLPS